jgi:hypothetical protein
MINKLSPTSQPSLIFFHCWMAPAASIHNRLANQLTIDRAEMIASGFRSSAKFPVSTAYPDDVTMRVDERKSRYSLCAGRFSQ